MGADQADEADNAHKGHGHGGQQSAGGHAHKLKAVHPDPQTFRGLRAAFQGVVIPAVAEKVQKGQGREHGDESDLPVAGPAQVPKGPVHHRGHLHVVCKVLQQGGPAAEQGAQGHAGEHHGGRGEPPQPGQAQQHGHGEHASHKGAQGDQIGVYDGHRHGGAGGVLNARVQADDGEGGPKGGALGHPQGGGRGQGVAQHVLHHAAGQGQGRAHGDGGQDPGQPHVPDDGRRLPVRSAHQSLQHLPD